MKQGSSSFVHLYYLQWDCDPNQLVRWKNRVSEEEMKKANQFVFIEDQYRYMVTRGFCRTILSKYLHEDARKIRFGEGKNKKPVVLTDQSIHFNLSHSSKVVLLAVSAHPVGVDIEWVDPTLPFDMLVPQFMSQQERRVFSALDTSHSMEAFYHCWTRKEAYIKALGLGFLYPVQQVTVPILEKKIGTWWDEYQPEEPARWKMEHIEYIPDYIGAVVHQGEGVKYFQEPF